MKYIKRLILENFQSHKYSEIDFAAGLNVIVGPSDTGKSAVIRALKWVLYNEPSGDFFIREGETNCSVTIHISDGTILQRYRTRSKNGYLLIKNDGEEMRFEGFGKDVPEEITDITNIRKILLDRDESSAINLGEQLEGPFLLSEKTSVRANAIGRLVGVNVIDDALADVLKDMKNLNSNRKNTEKRVENLKSEIKDYDYLEGLKIKLIRLNEIKLIIKEKNDILISLSTNKNKYLDIKEQINITHNLITKLKGIELLDSKIKDLEINTLKFKNLEALNLAFTKYKTENNYYSILNDKLQHVEKIDKLFYRLNQLIVKHYSLEKSSNKYSSFKKEQYNISTSLDKINTILSYEDKINSGKENTILLSKLSSFNSSIMDIRSRIKNGIDYINKIDQFVKIDEDLNKCLNNLNKLQNLNNINNNYKYLHVELKKLSNELKTNKENIDNLMEKYKQILVKNEKCPFCFSDITTESIDNIIKNHLGG